MKPTTISLWMKKLLKNKTADALKKNHSVAQKKLSPDQFGVFKHFSLKGMDFSFILS